MFCASPRFSVTRIFSPVFGDGVHSQGAASQPVSLRLNFPGNYYSLSLIMENMNSSWKSEIILLICLLLAFLIIKE